MIAFLSMFLGAAGLAIAVGWGLSVVVLGLLPGVARLPLNAARRSELVVALAVVPAVVAFLLVVAVVAPSLLHVAGVLRDHCNIHDHHPHLCAVHYPDTPAFLVGLGGLLLGLTLLRALFLARAKGAARRCVRDLEALTHPEPGSDLRVVPSDRPLCFAVGLWRPRVFMSQGLMDRLPKPMVAILLAHERAHLRRRDPLLLSLLPWSGLLGLPGSQAAVLAAFRAAAEDACDAAAARSFGALNVASSLVATARLVGRAPPMGALGFGDGDVERRVLRLLDGGSEDVPTRVLPLGVGLVLVSVSVCVLLHQELHHGVETLLHLLG